MGTTPTCWFRLCTQAAGTGGAQVISVISLPLLLNQQLVSTTATTVISWSQVDPDYLNSWADWSSYTWRQISPTHTGTNYSWAFMAGESFGGCQSSPTSTWTNLTLPTEVC